MEKPPIQKLKFHSFNDSIIFHGINYRNLTFPLMMDIYIVSRFVWYFILFFFGGGALQTMCEYSSFYICPLYIGAFIFLTIKEKSVGN